MENPNLGNLRVLGELSPQEQENMRRLRGTADQTIFQIGRMRVEEARQLGQLQAIEQRATMQLQEIGKRLGISEGTAWSVTADGRAVTTTPPVEDEQPPEVIE